MTSIWCGIVPTADPFEIKGGYSLTYFIVLYIIASYIRKYVRNVKKSKALIVYIAMSSTIFLSIVVLYIISRMINAFESILNYYAHYNSIFVTIGAVALFLLFLQIEIKNKKFEKMVCLVSPLTMGVYLIHDNPYMRNVIWKKIPIRGAERDILLLFKMSGIVIVIFCACICVDFIRLKLFALICKIKFIGACTYKCDLLPKKLYDYINRV